LRVLDASTPPLGEEEVADALEVGSSGGADH
jgi:hypothetical protein